MNEAHLQIVRIAFQRNPELQELFQSNVYVYRIFQTFIHADKEITYDEFLEQFIIQLVKTIDELQQRNLHLETNKSFSMSTICASCRTSLTDILSVSKQT